jgi:hypothetical protein
MGHGNTLIIFNLKTPWKDLAGKGHIGESNK